MELSLKYFINRNVRNLLFVFVIVAIVVTLITINIWPTLINMFAYYELDYQKAFVYKNLLKIQGHAEVRYFNGEVFNTEAQDMSDYLNVYKQNNKYKFKVKPVDTFDLYINCETTLQTMNGMVPQNEKFTSYKCVLLDTGNAFIIARVKPDFEINPNHEYRGVLVPLTKMLADELKEVLGEEQQLNNVFIYELDTLNNFSFYQFTDIIFLLVPLVIFINMGIKLIVYTTNYRKHPTYKLLEKMPNEPDENEALINSDLADKENVSVYKNIYTTKNWKITKGFYRSKICRMAKSTRFDD